MLFICIIANCSSLNSINVTNFNTKNVVYMHYMFAKCSSLNSIDVTKFDTQNVTMNNMFDGCEFLKLIYVSNNNINKFKIYIDNNLLKLK